MSTNTGPLSIANMKSEQLQIPEHRLHGWTHSVGLCVAEHVAATEFVIGATFVVQTRLSLYTYLHKIAGDSMTNLYNWTNVLIFVVIPAAMITVSSTALCGPVGGTRRTASRWAKRLWTFCTNDRGADGRNAGSRCGLD